jgi:DNA polymerase V
MFEDVSKQIRQKALQETLLEIRARYGKNSILKGMNYEEAATGRERNEQIGGHRRG